MSEYSQVPGAGAENRPEKINISSFLSDALNRLKQFWWVILAITLIMGALFYFHSSVRYSSSYTAEVTVAVELINATSTSNESCAEVMSTAFPQLYSGSLMEIVKADLNMTAVPASVSVSNIKGTNLLTITATGNNARDCYAVLQSVLKNYPTVARFAIGQTIFSVVYDAGLPKVDQRTSVIRGSVTKGLLLGLGIGFVLLIFYTLTTRTFRSEQEIERHLNVPVLGTLPFSRKRGKRKNGDGVINTMLDRGLDSYENAMRSVRARLERYLGEKKTVMVTSSIPGEGKSTAAANLAISAAKHGKQVILVDCDLRNPSQQAIFRLEGNYPGLERLILGEADLSEALVTVRDTRRDYTLQLLPGAGGGSAAVELLDSPAVDKIMEELKSRADLLILDTPPSAMLTDAMFLTRHVDGVVYVIFSDYARRSVVYRGLEELRQNETPIVGCILNGGRIN